MKTFMTTALSLLLALFMLLTVLPVTAMSYDWSDGTVPENWLEEYSVYSNEDTITATNILDPVNPNASREARNLYAYLCTLTDSQNYLIGQFDIQGDDVTYQSIKNDFGLEPAMYSCHYKVARDDSGILMPTFAVDSNGKETAEITNDSMTIIDEGQKSALLKAHYDNGNILLLHSDSAPREVCSKLAVQKGIYDSEADCIAQLDATNPDRDMQVYAVWMRYQESVMAVLKNLEASGVNAYLWRPWVEFNYHDFSGTNEAGYMAFTRVFQQTVQMAVDAGLTGFLATYSPGCWGTTVTRNPGNEYVDVYAATMYSEKEQLGNLHANQYSNYDWYVKTGKPIGFAEFSCRSGADAALQARGSWYTLLEDMTSYWPNACWFNIWGGLHYSLTNDEGGANGNDDGGLFLDNPFTLHLGEIVDYQTGVIQAPGVAQVFVDKDTYIGLEERSYTAADLKALGLSLKDMCALRINTGYVVTLYENADCTGNSCGYAVSQTGVDATAAKKYKSLTVSAAVNAALNKYEIYGSVNDGDAWKANDGYASAWSGDVNSPENRAEAGTAWLYIDLDDVYTITRYVLKSAGFAGRQDVYNTRDFQLQYSVDGQTWVTVDTVAGNTASQVSRHINAVTARYFRLLITGPNSSSVVSEQGVVTVAEFELYGVSAGMLSSAVGPEGGTFPDGTVSDDESLDDSDGTDVTGDDDSPLGQDGIDDITDGIVGDMDDDDATNDSSSDDDKDETTTKRKKKVITTIVVGLPWWAWVLIAVAASGVVVFVIIIIRRKKRRQKQSQVDATAE